VTDISLGDRSGKVAAEVRKGYVTFQRGEEYPRTLLQSQQVFRFVASNALTSTREGLATHMKITVVVGKLEVADRSANGSGDHRQTQANEEASPPLEGVSHLEEITPRRQSSFSLGESHRGDQTTEAVPDAPCQVDRRSLRRILGRATDFCHGVAVPQDLCQHLIIKKRSRLSHAPVVIVSAPLWRRHGNRSGIREV
jgi:hypothetical protein